MAPRIKTRRDSCRRIIRRARAMSTRSKAKSRSSSSKSAKALSKSAYVSEIAAETGLDKKQVNAVLDAMVRVTVRELKKTGVAAIVPGHIKVKLFHKAATPARQGRNPRTGEAVTIKAKPASKSVRARALKRLKEQVA